MAEWQKKQKTASTAEAADAPAVPLQEPTSCRARRTPRGERHRFGGCRCNVYYCVGSEFVCGDACLCRTRFKATRRETTRTNQDRCASQMQSPRGESSPPTCSSAAASYAIRHEACMPLLANPPLLLSVLTPRAAKLSRRRHLSNYCHRELRLVGRPAARRPHTVKSFDAVARHKALCRVGAARSSSELLLSRFSFVVERKETFTRSSQSRRIHARRTHDGRSNFSHASSVSDAPSATFGYGRLWAGSTLYLLVSEVALGVGGRALHSTRPISGMVPVTLVLCLIGSHVLDSQFWSLDPVLTILLLKLACLAGRYISLIHYVHQRTCATTHSIGHHRQLGQRKQNRRISPRNPASKLAHSRVG